MHHSRPLFLFFGFSILLILHTNFADDWIWTADLWCRRQPLYQLCHTTAPSLCIFSLGKIDKATFKILFCKKMGHPGLPLIYFRLFKQSLQFSLQIYVKNVMSIQCMALGFDHTTFGPWVSSHNQILYQCRRNCLYSITPQPFLG